VLVFPSDADKWFETSRTIRAARPDQQEQWQVKGRICSQTKQRQKNLPSGKAGGKVAVTNLVEERFAVSARSLKANPQA
jgi:hypothetical protein